MENSRNKQFISFKFHITLSSIMRSCVVCAILRPCAPTLSPTHLPADLPSPPLVTEERLCDRWTVAGSQRWCSVTLILFNNGSKAQE